MAAVYGRQLNLPREACIAPLTSLMSRAWQTERLAKSNTGVSRERSTLDICDVKGKAQTVGEMSKGQDL